MEIPATCIDDRERPEQIPLSKWVVKGTTYTAFKIDKLNQTGEYGVKLAELNIDDCYPYQYFGIWRFSFNNPVEAIRALNGELVEEESGVI